MTQLKINSNILKLKESATLAINLKSLALRNEGKVVYHWGFGQSPFPVPSAIQEELKNRTAHKEYLPTAGLIPLRETLKNFYSQVFKVNYKIDNIFISPGSKELIFQLIYLLEGEFYIPAPSWVSYGPQINLKGQEPTFIITDYQHNYKLTAEVLEKTLKASKQEQKILILNSPSNPTGQYYTDEELADLAIIFRKYNVIVVSDEIYSQVNFQSDVSPSLSKHYPEGTIITGGLSKAHCAGGYRLGYMIIPDQLYEINKPLKAMISETFSAVAAPIQYCAIKAWDGTKSVEEHIAKCTYIHKLIGTYFHQRYLGMGIKAPAPMGAFYMFIDFSNFREKFAKLGVYNCQQLADFLLEKHHIAILPGDDFYYPKESLTARIAFVDYDGSIALEKFPSLQDITIEALIEIYPQLKEGLDQLEECLKSLG